MSKSLPAQQIVLDDIDCQILRELQANARLTNVELAEHVHLSPSPCWNRVRSLEEQGVISKYIAILNQEALGMPDTIIVDVTLDRHDDETLRKFEEALAQLPEVIEAYLTTGDYDYSIKVAVAGTKGYEAFLRERLYQIPGIRHTRSSLALRCLKQTFSIAAPLHPR